MSNIEICVIGRKTPDFTSHLAEIRHISGLKVLKRRNKPFYDITGSLDHDRKKLMGRIDEYLELPKADRRAFQLLRRTLRAYDLDDMLALSGSQMDQLRDTVMDDQDAAWDAKMNMYICRYI